MYILVITRKKPLNAIIITVIALLLMFAVYKTISLFIPEAEITLEQRISIVLPTSTKMHSIYMKTPNLPAVEAGSLAGVKWKTEIIHQLNMSDITFQYPETLRLDEIKNLGHEISIHMNFHHNDNKLHGFFQVWDLNQPLKDFLSTSKKYSSMTFLKFKQSEIKVQELNGYLWEYVFMSKEEDFIGMEAFLQNGKEMYRLSVFIPKKNYKQEYKRIFLRMYRSLRVKGTGTSSDLSYVGLAPTEGNLTPHSSEGISHMPLQRNFLRSHPERIFHSYFSQLTVKM